VSLQTWRLAFLALAGTHAPFKEDTVSAGRLAAVEYIPLLRRASEDDMLELQVGKVLPCSN
jgi:hypothetical protein